MERRAPIINHHAGDTFSAKASPGMGTECIWVQLKTPADAPAGASAAYYGSFPVPRDAVEEERISNVKPELSDCGSTSSIRANLGGN